MSNDASLIVRWLLEDAPGEFQQLPKFLIADDGGDRDFVIHCHYPRFIMEFDESGQGTPIWIDAAIYDPASGEPSLQAARLMREAGDFFHDQMFGS